MLIAALRLLVCGGREYEDRKAVFRALDEVQMAVGVAVLIHGAARGADTLAGEWAKSRGISVLAFPADWNKHKQAAGPIRNSQMLKEARPTGVVAFPGGVGTEDMVDKALRAGLEVWRPYG